MGARAVEQELSVRDLADAYASAWDLREIEAIMKLHTSDTVFHMHTGQTPAVGAAAVREAFVAGLALLPDAHFARRRLRIGEDFWVAELTLTGHITGSTRIEIPSVDVVTVCDGLVARKDTYLDTAGYLAGASIAGSARSQGAVR